MLAPFRGHWPLLDCQKKSSAINNHWMSSLDFGACALHSALSLSLFLSLISIPRNRFRRQFSPCSISPPPFCPLVVLLHVMRRAFENHQSVNDWKNELLNRWTVEEFFYITLFAWLNFWSEITKDTIRWTLPHLQLNKIPISTEQAHNNNRTLLQHIIARLRMKKANVL